VTRPYIRSLWSQMVWVCALCVGARGNGVRVEVRVGLGLGVGARVQ
jgi:hypothetical protein